MNNYLFEKITALSGYGTEGEMKSINTINETTNRLLEKLQRVEKTLSDQRAITEFSELQSYFEGARARRMATVRFINDCIRKGLTP